MGCPRLTYYPTTELKIISSKKVLTFCKSENNNRSAYLFGFNTQEKVDEIAGKGNHNTALFWEYDTRLGRRWNLDPKPDVSLSQYATFANNPILISDHLGDTTKVFNSKGKFIATIFDNKENAVLILNNKASVLSGIFLSQKSSNGFNLTKANKVSNSLRKNGRGYAIDDIIKWDDKYRFDKNFSATKGITLNYKVTYDGGKYLDYIPAERSAESRTVNGLIRPVLGIPQTSSEETSGPGMKITFHSHPMEFYKLTSTGEYLQDWRNTDHDQYSDDRNRYLDVSENHSKVVTNPNSIIFLDKNSKSSDIRIDKSNKWGNNTSSGSTKPSASNNN